MVTNMLRLSTQTITPRVVLPPFAEMHACRL